MIYLRFGPELGKGWKALIGRDYLPVISRTPVIMHVDGVELAMFYTDIQDISKEDFDIISRAISEITDRQLREIALETLLHDELILIPVAESVLLYRETNIGTQRPLSGFYLVEDV